MLPSAPTIRPRCNSECDNLSFCFVLFLGISFSLVLNKLKKVLIHNPYLEKTIFEALTTSPLFDHSPIINTGKKKLTKPRVLINQYITVKEHMESCINKATRIRTN